MTRSVAESWSKTTAVNFWWAESLMNNRQYYKNKVAIKGYYWRTKTREPVSTPIWYPVIIRNRVFRSLPMTESHSRMRWSTKPVAVALSVGCMVCLLVSLLKYSGVLQAVELTVYDFAIRVKPAVAQDNRIVVLGIREADIARLGQWPLSDAFIAGLINQITALEPTAIGVDIYRDRPVLPGSDELASVLVANQSVVFVDKFGTSAATAVKPPAVLAGTDQYGFSDMPVDTDGTVRKGLLFLDDGSKPRYSFGLRLALKYLEKRDVFPAPGESDASHLRLGETSIEPFESSDGPYTKTDAAGYQFLLDYQGGSQAFKMLSLGELEAGYITTDDIKDKIVIVGVIADSVKDYFQTPFHQGVGLSAGTPGVMLHAHAISQLLRFAEGEVEQLTFFSEGLEYLWIFLWAMIGIGAGLLVRSLAVFALTMIVVSTVLILITVTSFVSGAWVPIVPAVLAWLASGALMTAFMMGHEKAERKLVMDLFSRHVSPDVAREIWKQRDRFSAGGRLETQQITATVLFTDLQDFTPVSESMAPRELMEWLNQYMESMTSIVMEHGGFVDDYYGDAIKANFGVPVGGDDENHIREDVIRAARCALAMQEEMKHLNARLIKQYLPAIRMRVGICTGMVVAGCLGSSQRMKYTTIGDTVNTAARLEAYGKELAAMKNDGYCRILVAHSTAKRLQEQFELDGVGAISLKGKSEKVQVYQLHSETSN